MKGRIKEIVLFTIIIVLIVDGRTVTVVHHRNEGTTHVDGFQEPGSFRQDITYDADMKQLEALTNRSTNCFQTIQYSCRNSRLLNSPCKFICSH